MWCAVVEKTFMEPKIFEEDISIISINSSDLYFLISVDFFLAPNEVGWFGFK